MERKFILSEKVLVNVVNYLASKPYAEVFQLINELQNLAGLEEPKIDTEEPKEETKEEVNLNG